MRIDEMRIALGLADDASDAEVITLYGAWLRGEEGRLAAVQTVATDPFAIALDAIFHAPGSEGAVYDDGGDELREIRVIRSQADEDKGYGRISIVRPALSISIRYLDVPTPLKGAAVIIGSTLEDGVPTEGSVVVLSGEPIADVEGLSFVCTIEPQP